MTLKNSVLDEMNDKKGERLSSPETAYKLLNSCMEFLDNEREHFIMLSLDTKNALKAVHIISIGSLNANVVHPREVFYFAVQDRASSIIVGHNHPSGDPKPSQNDIDVTRKLKLSGDILGIPVLDHIVFGDAKYISMNEENLMG